MAERRNRVVQVARFGGPDAVEVVDAPLPTAGRGEVRVRVLASSVVYTDVVIRRHLYPQTMRLQPPFVLGYDVVGEIDQLGEAVSGFQLGDCVADMTVVGSNAAYRTLRAADLTRVPAGVDAAEAATLILSWTTAYQLLHREARVQRGQRVLVQGAAGAVGQALLTLGTMAGLELWGTARSTGPRAGRYSDRLPTRRFYARPARRVRPRVRRHRRGRLPPFVRGAQGRWAALRLRIHSKRAAAASPVPPPDTDDARVSLEVVAGVAARRQADPHLLDQSDAGATPRLVPG
jgi:hypothetical protein